MAVPSVAFLRKVEQGKVKTVRSYSARRGGYDRFVGGEKMADAHRRAGYIRIPTADLGRPGVAVLTDAGRAALANPT